ncbi:MAG: hypothetical protein ACRCVJ_00895 [Clostridium sp.]|uniref:hypothetical protein n=1 Tax=Clostridium sp. TaxID=1506 RepID=UPI003F414D92
MKKSKLIIVVGILTIVTAILIDKPNKLQVNRVFKDPNSLISSFDNAVILASARGYNEEITQNLYDFISTRKRLSNSNIDFNKVDLKNEVKLSEKEKENILKDYKNKASKIKNYKVPDEILPFRFKADGINYYSDQYLNNESIHEDKQPITIDLVVINENGSYVFDYFWLDYNSTGDNEDLGDYNDRS